MRALFVAALAFSAAMTAPARADPPAKDRYELTPGEGGFMRRDRETGATSFCAPSADGYACGPTAEAAKAGGDAIARLEKRVAALEAKLAATPLPAVPPLPKEEPRLQTPTDAEIDKLADFIERAARRLKRFAEEMQKEEPPAAPDRQRL
ncbi:hypothetical protein [Hansschlegelia sp. KR7-227]|uniref:hypothetical protein n=1 Tax=Hansschlegelia sp. KR7-227 TaxID=3400914 RepID=UPI003C08ACF9